MARAVLVEHPPVFFHSQNTTGPWSQQAAERISRYPMATIEKAHASAGANGTSERRGPEACAQINRISPSVATVYYLNSAVDWKFYELHQLLEARPEWRLIAEGGGDGRVANSWGFNLSVPALRQAWVADCVAAVAAGCSGCFIDRSNNASQYDSEHRMSAGASLQYQHAHMETLTQLNTELEATANFAINNNQGNLLGQRAAMIEDFAASEHCITKLQQLAGKGVLVQAHAGDLPDGSDNHCSAGITNSLTAFLIGAGTHSYYRCWPNWMSEPEWPEKHDFWLDWLAEYDRPLGAPLGLGVRDASGVWTRSFDTGTRIQFDSRTNNGTVWWADGAVQRGEGNPPSVVARTGCNWIGN
eukprot:TRINITY_DN39884_c0_g1_i1.p1 TRINITY_DN39884_c0_g1~~TRINITY_DN39884_c0_g1_i1.p1  ORF type:complete len:358 (+),score=63.78 TRINITY_DN39884_c0_g1_i1:102-1175(+)